MSTMVLGAALALILLQQPLSPRERGAVSDLAVQSIDGATVTLSFTEVDDPQGMPSSYLVRFQESPFSVSTAASVTYGSCSGVLPGTAAGTQRTCTVEYLQRLAAGSTYEFQVTSFPAAASPSTSMASLSNIAVASPAGGHPTWTTPAPGPKPALITRHQFDQALEDGWHFRDNRPTEENFEHGYVGGDGYGQANYPVTLSPGSGPIQLRRTWDATDEVTVNMRWQVSPNFDYQTGSRAKKIWFLEAPSANPIYLALGGHNEIALMTQSTAEERAGSTRMQGGRIEPGRIYDIKVHIKLNSTSSDGGSKPDGVATVWLDGKRVIHRTDVRFRGEDSPQASTGRYFRAGDGITGLRWNPTWPGGGKAPREPMWERLYSISVLSGED